MLTAAPCCKKCRNENDDSEPKEIVVPNGNEEDTLTITNSRTEIIAKHDDKASINGINNVAEINET